MFPPSSSVHPRAPKLVANSSALTLLTSEKVTLECRTNDSNSNTEYLFLHDGKSITSKSATFTHIVDGKDHSVSGVYECIVQNKGVNSSRSNKIELHFVGKSLISLILWQPNLSQTQSPSFKEKYSFISFSYDRKKR